VPIIQDFGHVLIRVGGMDEALAFYEDLLGFRVVGKSNPVWTVVEVDGGQLTLWRAQDPTPLAIGPEARGSPINLHVDDFPRAASELEAKGVRVHRADANSGVVWDPFGNVIGLHDHRDESA
jgi:catechol 2,3-dioxygenase-like lactoylglutathione lyase family enzyme